MSVSPLAVTLSDSNRTFDSSLTLEANPMEFLSALWMPILVSAALVFVASFLTHMVLPHHKSEFGKLPDEDAALSTLAGVPAGGYMFPCASSPKDMNTPEFKAKCEKGPNGILVVWPGVVNMGQNLLMTFLFYILVGVFVAYISWHAFVGDSTVYLDRFRIAGATAFAAHGLGWMSFVIWFRANKFWPNFVDSVLYALLTAGTFAWLWPK